MPIRNALIDTATAEWKRWGFSAVPVHGHRSIGGTEHDAPFVSFVNDYWRVVGEPTWNGNTAKPWSAAFISFCFKEAGAARAFPYSAGHVGYCSAFVRHPENFPGLRFEDPAQAQPDLGDLIFAGRSGTQCPAPPASHAAALTELRRRDAWFCSHADIVVAVRPGEIDVIGGNVSDSVTMTTYVTHGGLIADPRHSWLGIIKNTI